MVTKISLSALLCALPMASLALNTPPQLTRQSPVEHKHRIGTAIVPRPQRPSHRQQLIALLQRPISRGPQTPHKTQLAIARVSAWNNDQHLKKGAFRRKNQQIAHRRARSLP